MLDRRREQESEPGAERARRPEPAAALQFRTPAWASAMGNQAVARLARQAAEEDALLEPESEIAEDGLALDELPEELPE